MSPRTKGPWMVKMWALQASSFCPQLYYPPVSTVACQQPEANATEGYRTSLPPFVGMNGLDDGGWCRVAASWKCGRVSTTDSFQWTRYKNIGLKTNYWLYGSKTSKFNGLDCPDCVHFNCLTPLVTAWTNCCNAKKHCILPTECT